MSKKSKGSQAERDLIKRFWEHGWAAMRAAGSGSTQFPSPDIIVGRNGRRLVIEAKITSCDKKYFPEDELIQLRYFGKTFGAESWLAIKFPRQQWCFVSPEDLTPTKTQFVFTKKDMSLKGISFEELVR
ncbi:MAG: Holliday junction resolvase Hjc [Candidatus Nanoarchaeia archaeon]